MKISQLDYRLPKNLIAQKPIFPRDHSRLMILSRDKKTIRHDYFYNLTDHLKPTDVLVLNQSKVIPARILTQKPTGGKLEILLLRMVGTSKNETWEVLTKPGLKVGEKYTLPTKKIPKQVRNDTATHPKPPLRHPELVSGSLSSKLTLKVLKITDFGTRIVEFNQKSRAFEKILQQIGIMPTPPYIHRKLDNPGWYQTIYAKEKGSAAAPTAGFHFTKDLFKKLEKKDIQKEFITLHVGLDTFRPIKTGRLEDHEIHSEWCSISKQTADRLNQYKKEGRRIIAVGTTTVRTLETATAKKNQLKPLTQYSKLFICPPYQFKFVDGLITNFHLPRSTLLALVSAFADREFILKAYRKAIEKKYRFYSFGDGMLIV